MPPKKSRNSASKLKIVAPSRLPRTRAATRRAEASEPRSPVTSPARDEGLVKFLREDCMHREDLQGAIPTIYDIGWDNFFLDLVPLRNAALEYDHAERVRLEHLALASFPKQLRLFRLALGLRIYRWLSRCNPREFPESTPIEKMFEYLNLATTSFICLRFFDGECLHESPSIKATHYPYILSHACFQGGTHDKNCSDGRPWAPGGIMPSPSNAAILSDIVLACGLDPATATREDMDALDARLVCKPCLEKNLHEADAASNWWGCFGHFCAAHRGEPDPNPFAPPLPAEIAKLERGEWVRLNPSAEAKAREISPAFTKEQMTAWRCALCPCSAEPRILKTWPLAQEHAKDAHATEAVRGKNFIAQDTYAEHLEDPVYIWQLRKAGLQEYFDTRALDNLYFDKLIKVFGRIPTGFPNRPGEKCWWQNLAEDAGIIPRG